jgi:hypothetical protein
VMPRGVGVVPLLLPGLAVLPAVVSGRVWRTLTP